MRLKYTEIKAYRQQQLDLQLMCCALCQDPVHDDAVLDHDHKTGLVRKVLHRGCNAMLGKIENNMARNRMSQARLAVWASNLLDYITLTHTDLVHPTYKEPKMLDKTQAGRGMGRGKGKKPPKR